MLLKKERKTYFGSKTTCSACISISIYFKISPKHLNFNNRAVLYLNYCVTCTVRTFQTLDILSVSFFFIHNIFFLIIMKYSRKKII